VEQVLAEHGRVSSSATRPRAVVPSRLMPTLDWNLDAWEYNADWSGRGDEWSRPWGGTTAQWWGTLYPRVRHYLPAAVILEIAPGYGRWTQFLVGHAERLIGVDLAQTCVDGCMQRFRELDHVEFHRNDGRSLDAVADHSVDLAFSFDSLVHVEDDVIGAYLRALTQKLADDGVAFLHHSNLGEHAAVQRNLDRLPERVQNAMRTRNILESHNRARSVSAARFRELCDAAGLCCVAQELISWSGHRLVDCISVCARPSSRWAVDEPRVVRNSHFVHEARSVRAAASAYTGTRGAPAGH
jgi:Methyltransferase domain